MQRIHFITGLPRSGSTLLAGILRQNQRFTAGMTSGLGGLVMAALRCMGPDMEFGVQVDDERRRRVLAALFESYYGGPNDAEVVFDTNRLWSAQLPLLKTLYPKAKAIACVRNPAWIMDSIERLVRKNTLENARLFNNPQERATVYSRADALASRDRLIGYAWSALKEAYYGDEANRLLLVEYDILCQRPQQTMRLIYEFIEEEPFAHDFDNVEYAADEFDARMGTPGLHTVKRKVAWEPRRTVLPPDVFERFANLAFWHDLAGTKAHKIVQQQPETGKCAARAVRRRDSASVRGLPAALGSAAGNDNGGARQAHRAQVTRREPASWPRSPSTPARTTTSPTA